MERSNTQVIVVGELSKNELASHVIELATLAGDLGSTATCVISAKSDNKDFDDVKASQLLGSYGVSSLHRVDCGQGLSGYGLASYVKGQIEAISAGGKEVIVIAPGTYLGRDVIAHLSAFTDRAVLANTTNVELSAEGIQTKHMVFGGTQIVTAQSSSASPHLVCVKPKSIAPAEVGQSESCEIVSATAGDSIPATAKTEIVSSEIFESTGPELDEATIVVSGGRGMGSKDNYDNLIGACADSLGGATGASRAIVDAGWVPYSKQVGQTGKTVKPDVYIACGISGATQHLVGMKGSKNIIAINTDDQAPIFSVADLGVVGDVNIVLPNLIEKLNARKS